MNLPMHRDYAFSASALISIYDDRIEFVSVGGLLPGIDLEDVMVGLSVCRNQNLANVFYRLQLIEAYGTGMRKIMNAYEDAEEQPIIETTRNAFKITLPNRNTKYEASGVSESKEIIWKKPAKIAEKAINEDEYKVLELLDAQNEITRNDVENLLGVSAATASRILRRMVKNSVIKQRGKARSTKYTLPE